MVATVTGSLILGLRKGTNLHKRIGYTYLVSMIGLNGTTFIIYDLFGYFGVFHWTAVFSSLTIFAGMIPIIKKKKGWIYRHFNLMYWSVVGLYAAFAAETLTRVPETPFFGMVGIATGLIVLLGAIGLRGHRKKWAAQFGHLEILTIKRFKTNAS